MAIASEAPAKKITAQEIALVDAAGSERAVLHLNDDAQPVLEMMDHAGKACVGLGFVGQDEVALRMADRSGGLRIALSVSQDQVPALRLYDSRMRPRTLWGVDSDGEPALDFYESSGKLLRDYPSREWRGFSRESGRAMVKVNNSFSAGPQRFGIIIYLPLAGEKA